MAIGTIIGTQGNQGKSQPAGTLERKPGTPEGTKTGQAGLSNRPSARPAESAGAGAGSHPENKPREKSVGLPVLAAEPKTVEVKIPGAEEVDKPTPAPSKKKKSSSSKPSGKADAAQTVENLKLVLEVVSNFLALKVDPEWKLSHGEMDQICEPLSRILSRHNASAKFNEYGDWIALLGACALIILPKMIIVSQKKKARKGGHLIANESRTPTNGGGTPTPKPNEGNVKPTPISPKQLPAALSAITGF